MSPEPTPPRVRRIVITILPDGQGASFAMENIEAIEGVGILFHTAIQLSMMARTQGA